MTQFNDLIAAARKVSPEFSLGQNFSAGGVAAAILGNNGKIYTGICIDVACGIGFCAEHAAVAEMLKDRETKIEAAVAVRDNANGILPPCGRCRELMLQINPENSNAKIILSDKIMTLGELMPEHWINAIGEKVA